ncbi:MAG: hypothetical protein D6712_03665, partial [Chloroflexi bacterium]
MKKLSVRGLLVILFATLTFFAIAQSGQPSLTATMSDGLLLDADSDGVVSPGDQIQYTVQIANCGDTAAEDVIFEAEIDIHTDLDNDGAVSDLNFGPATLCQTRSNGSGSGGSGNNGSTNPPSIPTPTPPPVNVPPVANDDVYNAVHTNVGLNVPTGSDVLVNDTFGTPIATIIGWGDDAAGAALNEFAVGVQNSTESGGLATLNADGSFTYDPPPGFTGTDRFYYHLNNGTGDVGMVELVISGSTIWFIDNDAGGANRGTLSNPFTSLGSFNGSGLPATGDFIHIDETGVNYGNGLTLLDNMTVIGEGASGTLDGIVASLAGRSPFSIAIP